MRKKTLSIILDVFVGLLVITIILLIWMIGKRGAAPIQAQEQKDEPLVPVVTAEQGTVAVEPEPTEAAVAEPTEDQILYATPDTSSTVHVRSGAGTNFDKLGSASAGEEFEVVSVLAVGWTKLNYHGDEGYIHNDYLDYYYKVQDENGNETREDIELADIPKVEE